MQQGVTRAAVSCSRIPTAISPQSGLRYPESEIEAELADHLGPGGYWMVDAQRLAAALLGDAIASNMFMLGYAWQKGLVPLSAERSSGDRLERSRCSDEQAGFSVGPACAHDPRAVELIAAPRGRTRLDAAVLDPRRTDRAPGRPPGGVPEPGLRGALQRLVERVRSTEKEKTGGTALTAAVARGYAKLLAYKDEYEVARLYSDPAFAQRMSEVFEDGYRLKFHLAPPFLNRPDPVSGEAKNRPSAVDDDPVQAAGPGGAAGNLVRSVRPHRRAPGRASADRPLRGDRRGADRPTQPSNSALAVQIAPFRRRSAASVTSTAPHGSGGGEGGHALSQLREPVSPEPELAHAGS